MIGFLFDDGVAAFEAPIEAVASRRDAMGARSTVTVSQGPALNLLGGW